MNPFEGGGSNRSILNENINVNGTDIYEHSIYLRKDKIESFVDLLKIYIFSAQFWVSLAVIFLCATHKADLFSLGYICAAFIFLCVGTNFYVKALRTIVKLWNMLLLFSVTVVVCKILFKILCCRFGKAIPLEYCSYTKVLDLPCVDKSYTSNFCKELENNPKYFGEVVTFVMIIMQRRIFQTYYFLNVINDTFTQSILASRFGNNFFLFYGNFLTT